MWCLAIVFILFMELGGTKMWEIGARFYSHHMWRASHKGGENSYGES